MFQLAITLFDKQAPVSDFRKHSQNTSRHIL